MALVEASRSVPRAEREPFMLIRLMGEGPRVQGNGYDSVVLEEDLDALQVVGLIQVREYTNFVPAKVSHSFWALEGRRSAGLAGGLGCGSLDDRP